MFGILANENPPKDQFLALLMKKVRDFQPFLEREESLQFLLALRDDIDVDLDWEEWRKARQSELLQQAARSVDYLELKELHDDLNAHEMESFLKVSSVPSLHRNCTEYRDLLADRALSLVEGELRDSGHGSPPCSYALVSMGSDGREEQTLITDQDYLLVYDDGEAADLYFNLFSQLLVDRLETIGFKKCTGDIMPTNPTWRGSVGQWNRRLTAIVRYEFEDYAKNLMDLIVLSDARYVAGNQKLAESLIDHIRALERDYFQVLWGMAKAATEMKLALGFLKRLWTEGSGEHKGEFNLKLLAWAPLVMNVRILAINQGIPASSTLQRIRLLQEEGSFSTNTAAGLIDSYHILTKHRILLQIKVIKGIQKDSYYLNPYELPAEEREKIRHALLMIEDLQKIIHTNFHIV